MALMKPSGMQFLKKASEMKPEASIKYMLHRHLSTYEPARPLSRIHASALTKEEGFCPRFYVLSDLTKTKPKDEWLTTSENVTFRMGRDSQDAVVHWFADMGKAIGHWKCLGCGTMHEFTLRPEKCKACGIKAFRPEEVRFQSALNGASCGVDMLVGMGEPKLRPVELKTMDKDQFKTLLAPLAEHKLRTNLYLRLIEESPHPWSKNVSTEKATIMYISKGGYGCADPDMAKWGLSDKFSPFKEFTITRDDSQTNDLVARAKAVTDFRAGKVGMPTGICPSALSKRAHFCKLKTTCFSGDHPPKHDWKA